MPRPPGAAPRRGPGPGAAAEALGGHGRRGLRAGPSGRPAAEGEGGAAGPLRAGRGPRQVSPSWGAGGGARRPRVAGGTPGERSGRVASGAAAPGAAAQVRSRPASHLRRCGAGLRAAQPAGRTPRGPAPGGREGWGVGGPARRPASPWPGGTLGAERSRVRRAHLVPAPHSRPPAFCRRAGPPSAPGRPGACGVRRGGGQGGGGGGVPPSQLRVRQAV